MPQPEIEVPEVIWPAAYPTDFYQQAPVGQVFRVAQAKLTLKTFRAGWLKGLAHAHVMTTDSLRGFVYVDPERERSRADLFFRPFDLILDDPQERAAAGPEFASERSPEDIEATRLRMLGPRQFHSNAFPFVGVEVLPGEGPEQVLLKISIRDEIVTKPVSVQLEMAADQFRVTSAFSLTHEELGLKPYSAFAGALAVAQRIEVTVTLIGRRVAFRTGVSVS